MDGRILFLSGTDFFDVKREGMEKFEENFSFLDVNYEKDKKFYFLEIENRKNKVYEIDTENFIPIVRTRGKFYYIFLVPENNPTFLKYVLYKNEELFGIKDFTNLSETIFLPKFGINYFYLDWSREINKKVFLIK